MWRGDLSLSLPPPGDESDISLPRMAGAPSMPDLAKAVISAVCVEHKTVYERLVKPRGNRVIDEHFPRFKAMALLRALMVNGQPRYSYPRIAQFMSLKDHTTVIHGCRRYAELAPLYADEATLTAA